MGSGIAAHLANLGFEVDLLDINREATEEAWNRAKKSKPAHLYAPSYAEAVRLGGIDTDLDRVADADWVCEAIIENLDAKRDLYRRIIPMLKPEAKISSNTSSLPLSLLADGMPESFRRKFVGTHFFNPPRYLKLLELIPTDETDPAVIEDYQRFLEDHVARRVVLAKDTPGFIANRFGMWSMFHAIHTAERLHMSIEDVDAVCGPFLGRPRSAAFRLNDLVGIDVMTFIAKIMHDRCPDDPYRNTLSHPRSVDFLLEKGWIGQKAGQGYYRKEGREFLALDLQTHAYRNPNPQDFPVLKETAKLPLGERIRIALDSKDQAGEFLRLHLIPALHYATYLREEVSHNVQDFDRVMQWGFGWEMGPFQMIDAIGAEALQFDVPKFYQNGEVLASSGTYQTPTAEPQYRTIKDYPVVSAHQNFNVRDLGEGVLAVALTTKMGIVTPALCDELLTYLETASGPMVLTSEARAFSVGFDLTYFSEKIAASDWDAIDLGLQKLQNLSVALSKHRIVSAVSGYCLGAGWEIAAACPKMLALSEANIGLPEAKVGLLPGGAGTARFRLRHQSSAADLVQGVLTLVRGQVSGSAGEAKELGYLRPTDEIVHHPDRLLANARAAALAVEVTPLPDWNHIDGPVVGMIDRQVDEITNSGEITAHDNIIGDRIKFVFAKCNSFDEGLIKEREMFLQLCKNALSVARIHHMIETGKPLRN